MKTTKIIGFRLAEDTQKDIEVILKKRKKSYPGYVTSDAIREGLRTLAEKIKQELSTHE